MLPKNVDALARLAKLTGGGRQADYWHFRHGRNSCGALVAVCGKIGAAVKPSELICKWELAMVVQSSDVNARHRATAAAPLQRLEPDPAITEALPLVQQAT